MTEGQARHDAVPQDGVKGRGPSRRGAWVRLGVGAILLLAGLGGARHTADSFAAIRAPVRQATAQEAPAPRYAARTVVGEPGRGASTLPQVRGLLWRLVAWCVVAGAGVALGVRGALLVLRSAPWRRDQPVAEGRADGRRRP